MTETTNGPLWMKLLGAFLIASFGGMVALTVFLTSQIGVGPAILTMLPALLVLGIGLILLTASVQVTIADQIELRFRPIWRSRLAYADIRSVRVEEQSWYRFGGVGLRWKSGATGLILGDRPALVIRTDRDHEYVVQCRDPQAAAARIRDRMSGR